MNSWICCSSWVCHVPLWCGWLYSTRSFLCCVVLSKICPLTLPVLLYIYKSLSDRLLAVFLYPSCFQYVVWVLYFPGFLFSEISDLSLWFDVYVSLLLLFFIKPPCCLHSSSMLFSVTYCRTISLLPGVFSLSMRNCQPSIGI